MVLSSKCLLFLEESTDGLSGVSSLGQISQSLRSAGGSTGLDRSINIWQSAWWQLGWWGELAPHSHPAGSRALSHTDGHRCPHKPRWAMNRNLFSSRFANVSLSKASHQPSWVSRSQETGPIFYWERSKVAAQSCLHTGQEEFVVTSNLLQHTVHRWACQRRAWDTELKRESALMYWGRLGRADGLCVMFWRTSGSLLSLRNLIRRTRSGRTVRRTEGSSAWRREITRLHSPGWRTRLSCNQDPGITHQLLHHSDYSAANFIIIGFVFKF